MTQNEQTVRQSNRWEQLKQSSQQRIAELKNREASLVGSIELAKEELEQVRLGIANLEGGMHAGDLALRNYWKELDEEGKNTPSGGSKSSRKKKERKPPAGGEDNQDSAGESAQ